MNNKKEESRTVKGWVEVCPSDLDGQKVYLNEKGVIRDLVGRRGTVIGKRINSLRGRNDPMYVYVVEFDEPYKRSGGWSPLPGVGLKRHQFTIAT